MILSLALKGSKCNEYPHLTVLHNDTELFNGLIIEDITLVFDLCVNTDDVFTLTGIQKRDGKNGVWDTTVDNNGNVINDKYLEVKDIQLDGISMGTSWIKNLSRSANFVNGTFWNNDSISFSIKLPLLDWIIEEKYIKIEESQEREFHSGSRRFDYASIKSHLANIRKLLND